MAAIMITALLCLSLSLQETLCQKRPELPNTFTLSAKVRFAGGSGTVKAASDFENGKMISMTYTNENSAIGTLFRYDIKKAYSLTKLGPIYNCIPIPVGNRSQGVWEWIKTAVYKGQINYRGRELDIWEANYTSGSITTMTVGVYSNKTDVPVVLTEESGDLPENELQYVNIQFSTKPPPADRFDIPHECNSSNEQKTEKQPNFVLPFYLTSD